MSNRLTMRCHYAHKLVCSETTENELDKYKGPMMTDLACYVT